MVLKNRIDCLAKKYNSRFAEYLAKPDSERKRDIYKVLFSLSSRDPSGGEGKYTEWMLLRYMDGQIDPSENLDVIELWLKMFYQLSSYAETPDITGVSSVSDLAQIYVSLVGGDGFLSKQIKTKLEKESLRNIDDIEVCYSDLSLAIYKINSRAGAAYAGIGTKWCTSVRPHFNIFDRYSDDLYVFIFEGDEKYQIHFPSRYCCDADRMDFPSRKLLEKNPVIWDVLKEKIIEYRYFSLLPDPLPSDIDISEAYCWIEEHFRRPGYTHFEPQTQYIPKSLLNSDVYELCAIKCIDTLAYVPDLLMNRSLCELAISHHKKAFFDVPESLKDRHLCELAVNNYGCSLSAVPESYIDSIMCERAVRQDALAFQYVPYSMKSRALSNYAVRLNGEILKHVPEQLIDRTLCETAVRSSGGSLKYIPDKFLDAWMCSVAVQQCGDTLKCVPGVYVDRELCEIAVNSDGRALICQHFTGHPITQHFAWLRNLRVTNSH